MERSDAATNLVAKTNTKYPKYNIRQENSRALSIT